jgi:putative glutamine amidotransferase
MIRIGLSYHNGKPAYDAYAEALQRRADALGVSLEPVWLAGRDRDLDLEELARVEAICLTGGADVDPARYGRPDAAPLCAIDSRRDEIEWAILQGLERRPRPLLAICRGAQILNVFHGGTLIPDLGELNAVHRPQPETNHPVEILPGTLLEGLAGEGSGTVNSSHHQAIEHLAPVFRLGALADDGTVEAYERREQANRPFLLAVQWHPERMAAGERLADTVLDAFLASLGANHHQDASVHT